MRSQKRRIKIDYNWRIHRISHQSIAFSLESLWIVGEKKERELRMKSNPSSDSLEILRLWNGSSRGVKVRREDKGRRALRS